MLCPFCSFCCFSSIRWPASDLQRLRPLLSQPYYGRVLWFTTWQATLSTLLTLLLGLPAAFVFARYEFRGKSLLRALTSIPFVLPTMVVATAFTSWVGPQGRLNGWLMGAFDLGVPPVDIQHTIWLILLAHVFYNVSIVVRVVGGFWANLDPRQAEAALFHEFRRHLGPGRASLRYAGGGDLPAGRESVPSATGGCSGHCPDALHLPDHERLHSVAGAARSAG